MPNPILLNLWACNPYDQEINRDAALALEQGGPAWGNRPDDVWTYVQDAESDGYNASEPGERFSADEWYRSLVDDWPTTGSVIAAAPRITESDFNTVKGYWDLHWRKDLNDELECFDYAQYQLRVACFAGTGDPRDETTYYQLFRERPAGDGMNLNRTVEAIRYVKESLASGIPVMAGIRLLSYPERPNLDKTTNHFVVIVGMGKDESSGPTIEGYYFSYYDYRATSTRKFFILPDLRITSDDGSRRLTQIRLTVRKQCPPP